MKNIVLIFIALIVVIISYGQPSPTKSRSAKTGRYVTKEYADKHPSTTVKEKGKGKK